MNLLSKELKLIQVPRNEAEPDIKPTSGILKTSKKNVPGDDDQTLPPKPWTLKIESFPNLWKYTPHNLGRWTLKNVSFLAIYCAFENIASKVEGAYSELKFSSK